MNGLHMYESYELTMMNLKLINKELQLMQQEREAMKAHRARKAEQARVRRFHLMFRLRRFLFRWAPRLGRVTL